MKNIYIVALVGGLIVGNSLHAKEPTQEEKKKINQALITKFKTELDTNLGKQSAGTCKVEWDGTLDGSGGIFDDGFFHNEVICGGERILLYSFGFDPNHIAVGSSTHLLHRPFPKNKLFHLAVEVLAQNGYEITSCYAHGNIGYISREYCFTSRHATRAKKKSFF